MPFAATILAALLGAGSVTLSNRSAALRDKSAEVLRREKEVENDRQATRETILVLSTNIEHIVTELRSINEEWRSDRQRNTDWQKTVEHRLGTVEARVDRYHGKGPAAAGGLA